MNLIGQLYQYRHFILALVQKEFKVRYTQSYLGLAWLVLEPLLLVITLSTIFTLLGRGGRSGAPFPVFFYSGLLAWQFFSNSVSQAGGIFLKDKYLVQKVAYPREISIFKNIIVNFIDFLFASVAFVFVLIFYSWSINWNYLFIPVLLLLQACFAVSLMFLVSSVNVYIRDVGILTKTVMSIWFWFTPIIFQFPYEGRTKILYFLNPMCGVINGYREIVIFNRLPPAEHFYSIVFASFIFMGIGYFSFKRLERNFVDVL